MRNKRTIPRVCRYCGGDFFASTSEVNAGRGLLCSVGCYNRERGARPTLSRTCRVCDTPLRVKASDADRRGAYCSRVCYDARPPRGQTRHCQVCAKAFYAYPAWLRKSPSLTCSAVCSGIAQRKAQHTGRSSWRYSAWRRAVFSRDKNLCQRCKVPGGRLHAHHIAMWSRRPDLRFDVSNGLTLHEECHRLLHIEQGTWYFA